GGAVDLDGARDLPEGAGERGEVDFGDGLALRSKSTWELLRALIVLRLCSSSLLTRHSLWLMRASRRVLGTRLHEAAMRATFYGQFVAGEGPGAVMDAVKLMRRSGLRALPAVPVEEDLGEGRSGSWYEGNARAMVECVELASRLDAVPMMQLKVTALLSATLCHKLTRGLKDPDANKKLSVETITESLKGKPSTIPFLTRSENLHLEAALQRLARVGQRASALGVRVLVDAETTYLNPALSLVALAMMSLYNQHGALVWNTYQCYLKDVELSLHESLSVCAHLGVAFGAKVVRGAYLESERRLAREGGYLDPVHDTWELTSDSYSRVMDQLLELASRHGDRCCVIVATHNEESVRQAVSRMKLLGIPPDSAAVCFGQLLGMCDHVSLTLGRLGYRVYKSLPYGTVDEVMPYLSRRAQENSSVLANSRAERQLMARELGRRVKELL
ncbi:unnamed protein product, partial [Lampetra fluviatilis]